MREYKVSDGIVKVGDTVWWHYAHGPKKQVVGEHDGNLANYPDAYSIKEPEWCEEYGYTGEYVEPVHHFGFVSKKVYLERVVEHRAKDIREAMKCVDDDQEIPIEWLKELIDIQEGKW